MQTQVVENTKGQTAQSVATVAASEAFAQTAAPPPPQTSPAPSPPETDTASGSTPNATPSEYDPARSRPRPKGWKPRFWPELLQREFQPAEPPAEEVVAEGTVRLDYDLVLRGGGGEVVRMKSQLVLPLALEPENLPQTDVSFPELVDQVIVRPLVTKFRSFLQRRFDAASLAATEKESAAVESPYQTQPTTNFKPSKLGNSASFAMPEIETKPPLPQRPSSRDWRSQ